MAWANEAGRLSKGSGMPNILVEDNRWFDRSIERLSKADELVGSAWRNL